MATSDDISVTEERWRRTFSLIPPCSTGSEGAPLSHAYIEHEATSGQHWSHGGVEYFGCRHRYSSPPATHLLSQMLLLLPMMHGAGEGFLLVTATRGRRTTPLALAVQYPASVEMVEYRQTRLGLPARFLWRIQRTRRNRL